MKNGKEENGEAARSSLESSSSENNQTPLGSPFSPRRLGTPYPSPRRSNPQDSSNTLRERSPSEDIGLAELAFMMELDEKEYVRGGKKGR